MNADEVVRPRCCNRSKGHRCSVCPVFSRYEHRICKATVDRFAAALIESLQAELADYHHMSELVDGKMEENQRLRRINENLQAQLSASQRREKAAVEDLEGTERASPASIFGETAEIALVLADAA